MLSAVLIAAAAVAAVLAGADRAAAAFARRRVSGIIAAAWRTPSAPEVHIRGPFLLQLIGGVYRQVRLAVPALAAGGMDFTDLDASLIAVRAPIRRLLAGDGIVITELRARFAIDYPTLSKRLPPGFALRRHRGELQIYSPALALPVAGTVAIDADLRHISVTPRVAGVPSLVGLRVDLPAMPPEVTISSITMTDSALAVSVAGRDVRLRANRPLAARPRTG